MKNNKILEQIQKFEPYMRLYRRDRLLFEKIFSQINTFLTKDKIERDIVYVPIKENPQKKVISALEEYFLKNGEWKQFRILLDRNWIFAVLTKNKTFV